MKRATGGTTVSCDRCESVRHVPDSDEFAAWEFCRELGWRTVGSPEGAALEWCPSCVVKFESFALGAELRTPRKPKAPSP